MLTPKRGGYRHGEHQAKGLPLTKWRPDVLAEEIAYHQRVQMQLDERIPGLIVGPA